jgi:hypothetical protein
MLDMGIIESEPDITKTLFLHKNWRVMLAGNDIAQVHPIVTSARRSLSGIRRTPTLKQVMDAFYESYIEERRQQAESIYLVPRGWTLKDFNSSKASILPESTREKLGAKIAAHKVQVGFIVAGFDSRGKGHIFSVDDDDDRGKSRNQDSPGYHAIGSGSVPATYMMAYREVSAAMPLRLVLYYAVEGKYFGERAGLVGTRTDVLVIRSDKRAFKLTESAKRELSELVRQLKPREIRKSHIAVLNSLPGEYLVSIQKLKVSKDGSE